jgi:hypothetical protein
MANTSLSQGVCTPVASLFVMWNILKYGAPASREMSESVKLGQATQVSKVFLAINNTQDLCKSDFSFISQRQSTKTPKCGICMQQKPLLRPISWLKSPPQKGWKPQAVQDTAKL